MPLGGRTPPGGFTPRLMLRALRDLVIVPRAGVPAGGTASAGPRARPAAGSPFTIAVVADAADARAVGTAVALLAAGAGRLPCALLCVCVVGAEAAGEPRVRGWAVPAARRLARSLGDRAVPAGAAGRLVIAPVDPTPAGADDARRALAAAASAGAAAVVAVGGPRDDALDGALARCDAGVAVLHPGRRALGDLAIAGLEALGVPAAAALATPGPSARLLSGLGATTPELRAAIRPALEEVLGGPSDESPRPSRSPQTG
jgi:hypothetical protein